MMQAPTPIDSNIRIPHSKLPSRCKTRPSVLLAERENVVKHRAVVADVVACPAVGQFLGVLGSDAVNSLFSNVVVRAKAILTA